VPQAALGSFAGGIRKAEYNSASGPQSGAGTSRRLLQCRRAFCCRGGNSWGFSGGVSGAAARVPGAGVFPFSAECRHLAREFLDAMQKLGLDSWSASTRERMWRGSFCDAVCTAGRDVQLSLWLVGQSGLNVGG
jgi:hypothetical protein